MHEKRTLTHTHSNRHTRIEGVINEATCMCVCVHCAKITDALQPCNASLALWDMIQHAPTCPPSKRAN